MVFYTYYRADVISLQMLKEQSILAFEFLYDGQFTLSTQLVKPNYLALAII